MQAKKKRKFNKKTFRAKLTKMVHKLLEERDGKCTKCGNKGPRLHVSHILPKGTYRHLEFDLDNVLLHCYRCHIYWWHLNPVEATKWFEDTYPARYNRLMNERNKSPLVDEQFLRETEERLKALL